MSSKNIEKFNNCLGALKWEGVFASQDVDESYDIFWEDFKSIFEMCFPVRKHRFNRNVHKINNFMTAGLLVSRRNKLNLHKISIKYPTELNTTKYKTYRNIYNRVSRAAKKLYFEKGLSAAHKDPKKTWDLLKEAVYGEQKVNKIQQIQNGEETITDASEMANKFNSFFATAGQKVADKIPPQ